MILRRLLYCSRNGVVTWRNDLMSLRYVGTQAPVVVLPRVSSSACTVHVSALAGMVNKLRLNVEVKNMNCRLKLRNDLTALQLLSVCMETQSPWRVGMAASVAVIANKLLIDDVRLWGRIRREATLQMPDLSSRDLTMFLQAASFSGGSNIYKCTDLSSNNDMLAAAEKEILRRLPNLSLNTVITAAHAFARSSYGGGELTKAISYSLSSRVPSMNVKTMCRVVLTMLLWGCHDYDLFKPLVERLIVAIPRLPVSALVSLISSFRPNSRMLMFPFAEEVRMIHLAFREMSSRMNEIDDPATIQVLSRALQSYTTSRTPPSPQLRIAFFELITNKLSSFDYDTASCCLIAVSYMGGGGSLLSVAADSASMWMPSRSENDSENNGMNPSIRPEFLVSLAHSFATSFIYAPVLMSRIAEWSTPVLSKLSPSDLSSLLLSCAHSDESLAEGDLMTAAHEDVMDRLSEFDDASLAHVVWSFVLRGMYPRELLIEAFSRPSAQLDEALQREDLPNNASSILICLMRSKVAYNILALDSKESSFSHELHLSQLSHISWTVGRVLLGEHEGCFDDETYSSEFNEAWLLNFRSNISNVLTCMNIEFKADVLLRGGLFSADFVVRTNVNGHDGEAFFENLIIMCCSSSQYYVNRPRTLLPAELLKHRLLHALGYRVLALPYWEWDNNSDSNSQYGFLHSRFTNAGVVRERENILS